VLAQTHDSWRTGGVGVWNAAAYDPETNLIFYAASMIYWNGSITGTVKKVSWYGSGKRKDGGGLKRPDARGRRR